MALTDHCDLFASVHEDGINRIITHVQRQRPSLFNYGSSLFANNRERMCSPKIEVTIDVIKRNNPIVTVVAPIPIPGAAIDLEWCMQIVKVEVDFHPGNRFTLPPQLTSPLPAQSLAIRLGVCAGVGVPHVRSGRDPKDQPPTAPKEWTTCCFCLDAFAVGRAFIANGRLNFALDGFEIVDIAPDGLECSIEMFAFLTIQYGILPKLAIALDELVFDLGGFATIALSPTPTSIQVPFNPSVAGDRVSVFINATIT